ncbi:GDP-mannose transporter GONST5, partial [Durusdinium trenchii]
SFRLKLSQPLLVQLEVMGAALSFCGNFTTALVLVGSDVLVFLVQKTSHCLVDVVDCICGSGKNTVRKKIPWHEQRYANLPIYSNDKPEGSDLGDLDVPKTMAQSKFPIAPEALVKRAKEVLASEFGTLTGTDKSPLAEDFQFVAPIVGPLSKKEFTQAFGSFKLREAVPDLADNSWFQVDPLEPNRVWFFSRATGTHTGPLGPVPPTGKKIELPPQAQSMLFNEKGECYTLTVGYCMDKRIGNSEGVGGVFGIVKAVGKALPFPEGQRLYTPSLRYEAFERAAKAAESLGFGPNAR